VANEPDAITRLVRACDPGAALSPDDPRYVNCDDVRGENLAQLFERSLRRADPTQPQVKLFAGHRGVGKTSELLRLKQLLEKNAFEVIYFDVMESLDPNDLDFPDLLTLAAAEVQKHIKAIKIPGFSATSSKLRTVYEAIKGCLPSDVALAGADIGPGFAKLVVEIKNRPNARKKLRKAIEQQSTRLIDAVNDLLDTANAGLRKVGREGLVLITDGLDKVVRRPLGEDSNTHERLFIDRSEQLASLNAHTVYTVPISLYYSPFCAQLEQTVGEFNVPLPMISIRGDDRSEPTPETPGMKKMYAMIEARCKFAKVKLDEMFDDHDTCHYLCKMSGGHPRHLMMLISAAASEVDREPITLDAAKKAVRNYANSLFREVEGDFWPKLRKFDQPQDDIPKDNDHQQMLLLLHIFEYMNKEPWYEVNPVLRTLRKFDEPEDD